MIASTSIPPVRASHPLDFLAQLPRPVLATENRPTPRPARQSTVAWTIGGIFWFVGAVLGVVGGNVYFVANNSLPPNPGYDPEPLAQIQYERAVKNWASRKYSFGMVCGFFGGSIAGAIGLGLVRLFEEDEVWADRVRTGQPTEP